MTLTINLSEKLDAALKAQARAIGVSDAAFVQKVLEQVLEPTLRPAEEQASRPQSARIREIWSDVRMRRAPNILKAAHTNRPSSLRLAETMRAVFADTFIG